VNLLGSRHFVKQRPLPLAHHRLAFSLNLDMIGRLRAQRLEVYGSRSAVGLRRAVAAANLPTNLELAFSWEYSEDSDHFPFLDAGVPTLMFHTGLHDEYHRPSDDTHLVNFAGIEPIASLALETLLAVADAEEPPVFREACREEREVDRRRLEAEAQPAPPKRWGLGTREDQGDPTAPIVVRVTPETPAARGGVLIGDRLLAINDQPLVNQADMVRKLGDAPDEVTVTIDRQGRLLSLQLVATP